MNLIGSFQLKNKRIAAKKLGKEAVYNEFSKRATNYKNVYDAQTGFM